MQGLMVRVMFKNFTKLEQSIWNNLFVADKSHLEHYIPLDQYCQNLS
jgi:hypothetical protein